MSASRRKDNDERIAVGREIEVFEIVLGRFTTVSLRAALTTTSLDR